MIAAPIYGKLDQGLIFSGCKAQDYPDCEVLGIIITARCDLAHKKATVYNYLPVVHFSDWLQHNYIELLTEEAHNECIGKLKEALISFGHAASILNHQTPRAILESLFPVSSELSNAKSKEQRNRMEALVINYEQYLNLDKKDIRKMHAAYSKIGQKIIKLCVKQNLNGYYFLPRVSPSSADLGYVILLREVKSMPVQLGDLIVGGLDGETYSELSGRHPCMANYLNILDGFAGPVGRLMSPYTEHLLQCFTALFSRIGLRDIEENYIANLYSRQPCTANDK